MPDSGSSGGVLDNEDDSPAPAAHRPRRQILPHGLGSFVLQLRVLVTSYVPLNMILFARVERAIPAYACLALAAWGAIDAIRLTWRAAGKQPGPVTIIAVKDSGAEVAGYLATYLLPLLAAPNPTGRDLVGYGIYALVIVVVSLRSDLFHVNPTLYLLGWRVVSVELATGEQRYLICRAKPRPGTELRVTHLYGVLHSR